MWITFRANLTLTKLYRFNSAPPSIKRYLYLTLVRPLLEYPSIEINKAPFTSKLKLQRIQNKAIRYICGVSMRDALRSETLHELAGLIPLNVRVAQLAFKAATTMRDHYLPQENSNILPYEKLIVDYVNQQEPINHKMDTHLQKINNNIHLNPNSLYINKIINNINTNNSQILPPPLFS